MIAEEKAYAKICASEYSGITGDTYSEQANGIYSIGNNVDIAFGGMDFTEGVSAIAITGRANQRENPVHIRFFRGDEVVKRLVEFPAGKELQTLTFPIDGFTGEGRVNFIFLPGSDFDFIDFRFLRAERE